MFFLLPYLFSKWPLVIIILTILIYSWYQRPVNFPPGPRGVPLLGALPILGKHPERTMQAWSKTFGPIMAVRFGPRDMVVLNDFNSIQQVSCSKFKNGQVFINLINSNVAFRFF